MTNPRVYSGGLIRIIKDQTLDLVSDTIVALLLQSPFEFDDADEFIDDISADELVASAYTRKTLTSKTLTVDGDGRLVFQATIPAWVPLGGGSNGTVTAIVLAKSTGSDATSPLICCWTSSPILPYTTTGIDLDLTAGSTGLFYFGGP